MRCPLPIFLLLALAPSLLLAQTTSGDTGSASSLATTISAVLDGGLKYLIAVSLLINYLYGVYVAMGLTIGQARQEDFIAFFWGTCFIHGGSALGGLYLVVFTG